MTSEELTKEMLENLKYGNAHADEIEAERHRRHCGITPCSRHMSLEEIEAYKRMTPAEREAWDRTR